MIKRLNLLIIIILSFIPNNVNSAEKVSVAVLPLEIRSKADLSYLKPEIQIAIKRHLQEDGAEVIEPELINNYLIKNKPEGLDEIRKLGIDCGADFTVWGSLTETGQTFSLHAQLIESFVEKPPDSFLIEGKNIENLPSMVKKLADEISLKLFKREKVAEVLIVGNKRIEDDAVKRIITTTPGNRYLAKSLSEDLKAVYSMGYFEDIRIEAEDGPDGKIITFQVKEKPTVKSVTIKGNRLIEEDDIRETLDIKTGSILNVLKLLENIERIKELYKEKNHHHAEVTYITKQHQNNQIELEILIKEGEKTQIKKIVFEGNKDYTTKKLKKIIKTSEKGFFSWLTSSGDLQKEKLNRDVAMLSAFYHNNGYIQAKIGEPAVEYKDDGIYITIKIDEGLRFKIGKVDVAGDLVLPKEDLLKRLKITEETFYNREVLQNDILMLTDLYSDGGYAFAEILPRINQDLEKLLVNITYDADKGKQVSFEKIIIGGNTRTRDKVIRRELTVYEQELYSGERIKQSVRNLKRLDYFEDVKVNTLKGSSDEKMLLKIDVVDKPTGFFSFGGGYSSVEDAFIMGSISQRNLFGRGQTLQLKAQLGGTTTRFDISFTEPWLFDIPLSAHFDLYNWETDYDDYDRNSVGGGLGFGYPVFEFTRVYLSYSYDVSDIEDIYFFASPSIWELYGKHTTNKISTRIHYDSRDKIFNPKEGSEHSLAFEYAGLGGDVAFTKILPETGWYVPLFWDTVGFLHAEAGFAFENSGGLLPDYERFYLGGMNSLRGFDWRDISPKDPYGFRIGGDKFVQFNFEFLIPLVEAAGIIGVLFFDTGDVYGKDEDINFGNLNQSAGYGFRWYSPMGPIRLEYGHILNAVDGETSGGRWDFTMGTAF